MTMTITMADKSVSTDTDDIPTHPIGIDRLENVLATLVENKVVAMRSESVGSTHSSPISRLASKVHGRFHSSSTVSHPPIKHKLSIDNVRNVSEGLLPGVKKMRHKSADSEPTMHDERRELMDDNRRRHNRRRRRHEDSDGECGDDGEEDHHHHHRHHRHHRHRHRHHHQLEDEDVVEEGGHCCCDSDNSRHHGSTTCWHDRVEPCILAGSPDIHGHSHLLETCSGMSLGEDCVVVLERETTKTRTRRKKRRRKHRTIIVDTTNERVKVLDPDELPRRARWTIMVTACLLLFLCLLLVGVTLRMAPLIDDMGE